MSRKKSKAQEAKEEQNWILTRAREGAKSAQQVFSIMEAAGWRQVNGGTLKEESTETWQASFQDQFDNSISIEVAPTKMMKFKLNVTCVGDDR